MAADSVSQLPKADLFDLLISLMWPILSQVSKMLTLFLGHHFEKFLLTWSFLIWSILSQGSQIHLLCLRPNWATEVRLRLRVGHFEKLRRDPGLSLRQCAGGRRDGRFFCFLLLK